MKNISLKDEENICIYTKERKKKNNREKSLTLQRIVTIAILKENTTRLCSDFFSPSRPRTPNGLDGIVQKK